MDFNDLSLEENHKQNIYFHHDDNGYQFIKNKQEYDYQNTEQILYLLDIADFIVEGIQKIIDTNYELSGIPDLTNEEEFLNILIKNYDYINKYNHEDILIIARSYVYYLYSFKWFIPKLFGLRKV